MERLITGIEKCFETHNKVLISGGFTIITKSGPITSRGLISGILYYTGLQITVGHRQCPTKFGKCQNKTKF